MRKPFWKLVALPIVCVVAFAPCWPVQSRADEQPLQVAPAADPLDQDAQTTAPPLGEIGPAEQPRAIQRPRDLLKLLRVDDSHFAALEDGRPMHPDEQEALLKILFAASRFDALDIRQFLHPKLDLAELHRAPAELRGEIYLLSGFARKVTYEKLAPEVAERFDMEGYYRCEMTLGDTDIPVAVYSRRSPKAWKLNTTLAERASAEGFFLKLEGEAGGPLRPAFVARRLAWHPGGPLGDAGMDMGLWDDVASRGALRADDTECFYRLLHEMRKLPANQLHRFAMTELPQRYREAAALSADYARLAELPSAQREFHLKPLLENPRPFQGKLVVFEGIARRATRIAIEDPDIAQRFGFKEYWELEVFCDQPARFGRGEKEKVVGSYPIVCCVRELPSGMPWGPDIGEKVRVSGAFFKLWSYRSEAAQIDPRLKRHQDAPLILASGVLWAPAEESQTPYAGLLGGALFVGAGLLFVWGAWRYSRGDRRFRQKVLQRHFTAEPGGGDTSGGAVIVVPDKSTREGSVTGPDA
ncbi:MAG: hypothetical protein HYS13_20360 [Planctomycetia bacterium]|nr:hypothetical protein [Planctomycetia bacterium]